MAIENKNYLGSEDIKVYPTAHRGTGIDVESVYTSEHNVTTSGGVLGLNYKSFVMCDNDQSATAKLIIVISGYRFETTVGSVLDLYPDSPNKIYAYIHVVAKNQGLFKQLVNLESGTDALDDLSSGKFYALGFSTSTDDYDSSYDYIKVFEKNENDVLVVPASSKLLITTNQIQDGTVVNREAGGKSINECFTTKEISADSISTTSGIGVGTDLSVAGSSTFSGNVGISGNQTITGNLDVSGDSSLSNTQVDGALTVGTKSTNEKSTQLNGSVEINNQATGFILSGGKTTSKSLDVQCNTSIKGATNIYTPLEIGASGNTSKITIKQTNNKTLVISGGKSSAQSLSFSDDVSASGALTFSGASTFQAGDYASGTTSGSESVTVGGNSFAIVTRDTAQTISGNKTHSGTISVTNATASSSYSTGALIVAGGTGIGGALNVHGNAVIDGSITFNNLKNTSNNRNIYIGADGKLATQAFGVSNTDLEDNALRFVTSVSQDNTGALSTTTKKITIASATTSQSNTVAINGTTYSASGLDVNSSPSFKGLYLTGIGSTSGSQPFSIVCNSAGQIFKSDLETTSPSEGSSPQLAFISAISQDSKGKITATKEYVQSAGDRIEGIVTAQEQIFSGLKKLYGGLQVGNPTSSQESKLYGNVTVYSGSTANITMTASTGNIDMSGDLSVTGNISANYITSSSDIRFKDNFRKLKTRTSILNLPVYKFDYINDGRKDVIGCIAQDLQQICPEIVHEDNNGYLTIEETKLVYLLLEEVKRLRKEVNELKGE